MKALLSALPAGVRYVACAAGFMHSVLLRDDGQAVAFGGDLFGDGTHTLLVSSWESDRSARDAGEVYILDPDAP